MIAGLFTSAHRRAHGASALLGGLIAAFALAGVLAAVDLGDREATLDQRRLELRAIVKRLEARGPELARAERTLAADPFLPGATPTLAANALQRRVVAVAEESGVALRTIGAETGSGDADAGGLPRVTLQATAGARIAALQKFLYRIETEAPFVLVEDLSLRGPPSTPQGESAARDPELEIDVRLVGFLKRSGG